MDLTAAERAELGRWVRRRKSAQDMALRARIALACDAFEDDGYPVSVADVAVSRGCRTSRGRAGRGR
ncbi:hypothetical protein GCM10023205_81890 [Yinghuangia aomiensis]|uniref:Transposase n=1 Tax=Yinghuangia aomiensis TaxID=676205 RepID=A0ABP9IEZ3_9ACTN